jgi:hypothetical protein
MNYDANPVPDQTFVLISNLAFNQTSGHIGKLEFQVNWSSAP